MADGGLLSVELVQDLEIILLGRMADHGGTVIYLDDIDPLYVLVIKPAPLCGALEQAVAVILQRPDYSLCVECSAAVYCVCPLPTGELQCRQMRLHWVDTGRICG